MTAVATTARATVASVVTTAVAGLERVDVRDFDPPPGVALGNTAVIVTHDPRGRHMDRYSVRVQVDPTVFGDAAAMVTRAETVTETVDLGLASGLPAAWQIGTWTFGFDPDPLLFVARCELLLPTADPTPEATTSVTIGTLTMGTARAAIAAACSTAVGSFTPAPSVYAYPTWPGDAVGPVAVVVSPLGLDRDMTWHQVAVLVSSVIPADQAQDWLDDLVVDLDDGLRDNLAATYFLAGPGSDDEQGWDRAGWSDELDCWTAQIAVGHYR